MKTTALLNRAFFATALIAVSAAAFANGGGSGPRGGAHNAPYPYTDSRTEPVVSAAAPLSVSTQENGSPLADDQVSQGKTRAQVRAELLQAEESGEFARMEVAYRGH
jgi:hypothetical protein